MCLRLCELKEIVSLDKQNVLVAFVSQHKIIVYNIVGEEILSCEKQVIERIEDAVETIFNHVFSEYAVFLEKKECQFTKIIEGKIPPNIPQIEIEMKYKPKIKEQLETVITA